MSICNHSFHPDNNGVFKCLHCGEWWSATAAYPNDPYDDRDPWQGRYSEAAIRDIFNPDEGDKR